MNHHSARARRAIACLATVAVVPFVGSFTCMAGAGAQEAMVRDAVGDVQRFDESSEQVVAAPEVTNGDIVRTRYRHNEQ
ncbi:MAG TPA: hypothetical protein VFD59_13075 [Nocardioidaceae bacterium]|nr:hypothetical protein [Nocardioidaceae bacterium]